MDFRIRRKKRKSMNTILEITNLPEGPWLSLLRFKTYWMTLSRITTFKSPVAVIKVPWSLSSKIFWEAKLATSFMVIQVQIYQLESRLTLIILLALRKTAREVCWNQMQRSKALTRETIRMKTPNKILKGLKFKCLIQIHQKINLRQLTKTHLLLWRSLK